MSDGLNRWQGIGNLGRDPELKVTQGGQTVMNLSIGCNESYLDRNNVRQDRVEWVRIAIWGRRAEALAKILHKGDRIYVEGGLSTSSYEKDGEKRYSTSVTAREVILCGGGGRGDSRSDSSDTGRRRSTTSEPSRSSPPNDRDTRDTNATGHDSVPPDDDIPF